MDSGRTFDAPVVVDEGALLGRVDVAILQDDSVVILFLAHSEDMGERAELRVRRYTTSGADDPLVVAEVDASRRSGFPRLASLGNRALVAWTAPGGRELGTALLELVTK